MTMIERMRDKLIADAIGLQVFLYHSEDFDGDRIVISPVSNSPRTADGIEKYRNDRIGVTFYRAGVIADALTLIEAIKTSLIGTYITTDIVFSRLLADSRPQKDPNTKQYKWAGVFNVQGLIQ